MRDRLEILHRLLAKDGTLFVNIDDNELGYLIVLLDEIFGRSNRVYAVTFKQGSATGHKAINPGCVNTTNYILIYARDKSEWVPNRVFTARERDVRYNQYIVNIEEDKTMKNQSVYLKETNNHTNISRYKHPTQHLIISLLFSSYNKDLDKYLDGLDKLRIIISYFQQNNSFYYKNDDTELIDYTDFMAKTELEKEDYSKITTESVSLSMDQLNQMWSYLGSRYMPSVLYKMRLCTVQGSTTTQEKVIKKVKINLWENDKNDVVGLLETKEFEE